MKKIFYLYRHIRLDNNEVFYIGVGNKDEYSNKYYRAHASWGRNQFWRSVASKTDFKVQILFESYDFNFIAEKEIEFISLYGRRSFNTGTLVNITRGGQVVIKQTTPEETRKKISLKNKGELNGMYGIHGEENKRSKPVLQYDEEGNFIKEWINARKASEELGISFKNISSTCNGHKHTCQGYIWKFKNGEIPLKVEPTRFKVRCKKIEQLNLDGSFIREWNSITEASKELKLSNISSVIHGLRNHSGGFLWKFK